MRIDEGVVCLLREYLSECRWPVHSSESGESEKSEGSVSDRFSRYFFGRKRKSDLSADEIRVGKRRYSDWKSSCKTIAETDYDAYDLLIGMDRENLMDLKNLYNGDPESKIHLLMEYTDHPDKEIEDPWYTRRFTECVQLLKEGCEGLLEYLEKQRKSGSH